MLVPWKKNNKPRQHIKKQGHDFADKILYGQCCFFPVAYADVWMPLNSLLEKTLESHLAHQEIKPVNPKGNQSWIFFGRTDTEAESPILWPLNAKNWLVRKDPEAGKDWRQEEKGITEAEMVGWHHWRDGHEFEQALGVDDGQGSLACCSPWGHKKSDTTEWLNWTETSTVVTLAQEFRIKVHYKTNG